MKISLVAAGLLAVPLAAQAALPPQYQRQRELKSIISSAEVEAALDSQPIDSISTDGDDVYIVTAGACSVVVTIVSDPPPSDRGWAGPRQYHIEVGETSCSEGEE